MKIAIIGAGWAGLAATQHILEQGCAVDLYEASHTLGGRARTVYDTKLGCNLDNGQHILLGAYNKTLTLIQQLGLKTENLFIRKPLHIESVDGSFCIKLKNFATNTLSAKQTKSKISALIPADLIFLNGLIAAKGISYKEKLNMILAIRALKSKNWQTTKTDDVYTWLKAHKQSENIIKNFWQPLCIAALNTPVNKACAQLFANVLRDSIGGKPNDSDILISKLSLTELWAVQLEKYANNANNLHSRVNSNIKLNIFKGKNITNLNDLDYDAVILACNIPSSIKLLETLTGTNANCILKNKFISNLYKFKYNPISTVSLKLSSKWKLPETMYMLHENRNLGFYGQWLFTNIPAFPNIANIVISDANVVTRHSQDELVQLLIEQLQQQTKRFGDMPKIENYQIITEKRATFCATPSLHRPDVITPWSNVFLAGDFTDTGYPAVLEGAVRSGLKAAAACVDSIRRFA